jgi:DNA-binding Lrp family transcriptional regulator
MLIGMTLAFVLITTDLGREKNVVKELRRIAGVSEAYISYGVYDVVVKVEAETQERVKDILFSRIRKLDDVRSTLTLVEVD